MTIQDLSCVHIVPSLASITGGPAVSVSALCGALAERRLDVRLCTADDEWFAGQPVLPPTSVPVIRYPLGTSWIEQNVFRGQCRSVLARTAWSSKVIHSHGIWTAESVFSSRVARQTMRPHIVSCRGMLEPWALRFKRIRKWIALSAYQRAILSTAAVLHATSEQEATSIRSLGFRNPIAVIPNGVAPPERDRESSRARIEALWPSLQDRRILLFCSRLHRKKGVEELLTTWKRISGQLKDWVLVFAGVDEQNYAIRHSLGPQPDKEHRIAYVGHVSQGLGSDLVASASLLVLPSYSENFGNVIAEALVRGTPALTTDQTPWLGLNDREAGRCIALNPAALESALIDLCNSSPQELAAMGERGRTWMLQHFSWMWIAEQMELVYRWILEGSDKPGCVDVTGDSAPVTVH